MAQKPNEKAQRAYELYKTGMRLVDIASELEVPDGTVRRWKSTYGWGGERSRKKANVRNSEKELKKKIVTDEVRGVMQNTELNDRQRLFCLYYVRSFNATKAYQKAYGCTYAAAMQNGNRLLRMSKVNNEIQRLKEERLSRELLNESDIFQKYIDIAYADMTDYVEFDKGHVSIKNSNEVDGTIISEISKGKDGVKVKLADRMKALQWLSDHMDIATEKQKAEIALLKAKMQTPEEEVADDGFLDALNASAGEDWSDDEN